MSRKKKTDGVQDALIPDEITPLMLLALTAKASRMKDAAAAFRIAASKMLDLATKDEYIEKYKNIDPITTPCTTPAISRSTSSTPPTRSTTSSTIRSRPASAW